MKLFYFLPIVLGLQNCTPIKKTENYNPFPSNITKNMMNWLSYEQDSVRWSEDYLAFNTSSKEISKDTFLLQLQTGLYFPLKVNIKTSPYCYQLYPLNAYVDEEIKSVIKAKAKEQYDFKKREGIHLPKYKFIDLNDNVYTNTSTKGFVLVLNCWFIHCQSCVAEIPKLNILRSKYMDNKNVLFLALAFDSRIDLKKFLQKVNFNYSVISECESFLRTELKIESYPTHIIINRFGEIVKVIAGNDVDMVEKIVQRELLK
jgi:thiol-disulfide isomerase/thioredoxin